MVICDLRSECFVGVNRVLFVYSMAKNSLKYDIFLPAAHLRNVHTSLAS